MHTVTTRVRGHRRITKLPRLCRAVLLPMGLVLLPSAPASAATSNVTVVISAGSNTVTLFYESGGNEQEAAWESTGTKLTVQATVDVNTTMVLEASAGSGYRFTGYSGSESSGSPWISFWVGSSALTIDANFAAGGTSPTPPSCPTPVGSPTPTVLEYLSPFANGTIQWSDGAQNGTVAAGREQSITVGACSTVDLTAVANSGYKFQSWNGAASGTNPDTSFVAQPTTGGRLTEATFIQASTTSSPTVVTGEASVVATTTATLNGSVNPNGLSTTYYFEYGTSQGYGFGTTTASAGSGTSAVGESAGVTGLNANTTYDFQLVASNSDGTTYGGNETFKTMTSSAAHSYVVNTTADGTEVGACSTGGSCTLRQAIDQYNSDTTGADTITFSVSTPATFNISADGTLSISNTNGVPLTITGAGTTNTIIDGGESVEVLSVGGPGAVTITGVTIQHGSNTVYGAGILTSGGAANLTLDNVDVSNNQGVKTSPSTAAPAGAGIFNGGGTLTLNDSTVSGNTVTGTDPTGTVGGSGAGIYNDGGTLTLNDSTVSGNTVYGTVAGGGGGGIFSALGTVALTNSIVSDNTAPEGGGIYSSATSLTSQNSTVTNNDATTFGGGGIEIGGGTANLQSTAITGNTATGSNGGGVLNYGNLTLTSASVTGNAAVNGGGDYTASGTLTLDNSTVSTNTASVHGGGIYEAGGTTSLTSTSVVNNTPDNIYPPSVPVSPPTVTNCNDSGTGSLRQAVAGATSGETISFALSPSCSVITLTSGDIDIGTNLTIDGPGAEILAVSGNNASQVFVVDAGVSATISGLTIENGSAGALGCSTEAELATCFGAGIDNNGTLYLSDSTVANNKANSTSGFGGGIMNTSGLATLYVTDSTISGNSANLGGGIYNNGADLIVSDSTVAGNSAVNGGGGIYNQAGTVTVTHGTLAGNSSPYFAGGIVNNEASTTLVATIVADQTTGTDCAGTITDGGYNLDDDGSCGFSGTSLSDTPAGLSPSGLQNNGGPTQTIPLESGSAAINHVTVASDCTGTDQSGDAWLAPCDIGAVGGSLAPASPTFWLELSEGESVYTVFFYGNQAAYSAFLASETSADPSLPLLAEATYLVNAVEPPQGAISLPIYAVQAYPGTGATPTFGQPSGVTGSLLDQLADDALLWAYSYVNDVWAQTSASLGATFTSLYQNELSQQVAIVAGEGVDLLTIFGPLFSTVGQLLGSDDETVVANFVSLFEDIASGSIQLGQDFANATGVSGCLMTAGVVNSPNFLPGAAVLGLSQAQLSSGQLSTFASCIYTAAYGSSPPSAVGPKLDGFLTNVVTQTLNSAIQGGATVLAEGANSFLTLYFNAGFSATDAATAATQSMDAAWGNAFDANFVPLALASAVVQTFILPAVDQLQEEVNLQNGGQLLAAILTTETPSLTGPVINGAGDEAAFDAEGALFSMFGQWASADYNYQSTLLFPNTTQQASDQLLAQGAEVDANYVFEYEQVGLALAAALANEQTATSSTPAGTASTTVSNVSVTAQGQGSIAVKSFGTTDPVVGSGFAAGTEFFDVAVVSPSSFSSVAITACGVSSFVNLTWWNGTTWEAVRPSATDSDGCLSFTATDSTSPSVSQLTGTVFAVSAPVPGVPTNVSATVPGAPTNVVATAGNASAMLTWAAPSSNGGSAITGYAVTPYIGTTAQTTQTFTSTATTETATGLTNGTAYTFTVAAINTVGTGPNSPVSNSVTPVKAASTTVLKLSATKVTYGHEQVEHVSVTVSPQYSGITPTGRVTIEASARTLCVIKLVSGTGLCKPLSARELNAGSYRLVASYGGDESLAGSVSPSNTLTVAKATSTTILNLSIAKITYGDEQVEHLSVTVSPRYSGTMPTGRVTIKESKTTLCTISLSGAKGSCTLSPKKFTAGKYHLLATYGGSTNFKGSSSAKETLTVAK